MEKNTRYYDDEREIDLTDLLGRIIAKWRTICVILVIGFLVGIAISCGLGYNNMKKSDVAAQRLSAQKAEALALEKLLKDEKGEDLKENADKNLIKYVNIQSLYKLQEDYNEKSIYKNLDATHIAKATLTYYIDNHYVNEYPVVNAYNNISDIMGAYSEALISDKTCNDIAKVMGISTEPKYIKELVSVGSRSTSNLVISIYTDNPAVSGALSDYYKEAIEEVTDEIIENYGDVTISLQDDQLYTESDIDVMTAQNNADSKLLDYYDQLQTIEKSMSGAQGDYFKAILAKYNLETVTTDAEKHGLIYYVSKKLIVLIAVLTAFIAVAVYGVIYLLDGSVKTGDEMASISHSTLLGNVLVDNDKNKKAILFDKWAIALTDKRAMCEDSDRMIKTVTATIKQYLDANNLQNMLIVGSDIKHVAVVDKIKEDIISAGYIVNVAVDAFDSPETVNNITKSDIVIFMGEIGKSKYKKLERVLSLCNLYKKSIMGTVAIQERIC